MKEYYWDGKLDYLDKSTRLYYNDDYMEFLVRMVWGIDRQPVHVIDFGCGFGHLGLRLMPLLPVGSTYTGIDAGEKLIRRARELFQHVPFAADFIQGDFLTMTFERKYDLAVCHAVLLHMTEPTDMLRKMKDAVVDGGRMACFEPHWNANMASYHFAGIETSDVIRMGILQKLYEHDAKRTGKDGNIGLKLPLYLNRLGLRDIQCRVSDRVNVHIPGADPKQADALFSVQFHDPGEPQAYRDRLIERGLTADEADSLYEAELLLHRSAHESVPLAYAPSMKISFGTVLRDERLEKEAPL